MKKLIVLISLFLQISSINAQDWLWATRGGGGTYGSRAVTQCLDNNGNIYVTGTVSGPISYFNTDTFTVNGSHDIFLAKYDNSGNELWVKHYGGPYNNSMPFKQEGGYSIIYSTVDDAIYLSGIFVGSCTFGSFTVNTNPSDKDVFICKLDVNGNCLWAKSAGSGGDDTSVQLELNPNGDIFVVGSMRYTANFDTLIVPQGGFLAKYDTNGNCNWVKIICSGNNATAYGSSGNPYSINFYDDALYILVGKAADTLHIDTITIVAQNDYSNVLAKFDTTGNIVWAKVIGSPSSSGLKLSMDSAGNCYFGGIFCNGFSIIESDTIYSNGSCDFYFVKYDKNGVYKWKTQSFASQKASAWNSSTDSFGNVYIAGEFKGTASFGSYTINSSNYPEAFVARYDSLGNCLGVNYVLGESAASSVTTSVDGTCNVVGKFKSSCVMGVTTLNGLGFEDIFVGKVAEITGINEIINANSKLLKAYPNPNGGNFILDIPAKFSTSKNLVLTIIDVSGKRIFEKNINFEDGKANINISKNNKGPYTLRLTDGVDAYTGSVIID
jgi:hypothetical protein